MSGFARASDAARLLAVALGLAAGAAATHGAPARVVSVNLCTDQLAMMLAAPGQLVSVSSLARDPLSSAMADEARRYGENHGQAEEVFLLHPDLVLAGTYTTRATVELLRRLGVRVEEFPPVTSMADVRAQIVELGAALGRAPEASAMLARFDADLAALTAPDGRAVTAALYFPNGYTTGAGTLADEILRRAGLRNIGAEAGVTGGGVLPLERLVMAAPDLIVTAARYPGASRAEEILSHPALAAVAGGATRAEISDADWTCGTPYLLRAVAAMAGARRAVEARQ